MKKLFYFILLAAFFAVSSCSAPKEPGNEDRISPNVRDTVWKDTTGTLSVLKQVNGKGQWVQVHDTTWQKQVVVPLHEKIVRMSQKQVNKYVKASGYWKEASLGVFLLLLFIFLIIKFKSYYSKAVVAVFGVACLAYLGSAIRLIQGRPYKIAENNYKRIHISTFNYYQKKDSTWNYFWDSVYKADGIIDAKQPKEK